MNISSRAVIFTILILFASPSPARAQGDKQDYARAAALRGLASGKVHKSSLEPHWFADSSRFWYRNDLPAGAREFLVVNPEKATKNPAFDPAKLAKALAKTAAKDVDPNHLPFDRIEITQAGLIRFEALNKPWNYEKDADLVTPGEPLEKTSEPQRRPPEAPAQPSAPRQEQSPDGLWSAFIKDHNLHLRQKQSGKEYPLSREGTESDAYESAAYWSPDSKKLVALRTARGDDRKVTVIESSPKNQTQPKLHAHEYLKPGDRVPITRPHLFDVESHKEIPIPGALFDNPWSIDEYRWAVDSTRFSFLYNQRGHQVLRLISIDSATGAPKTIIDEQSPTFIDYSTKTFLHHLQTTHEILWASERDGYNHLYLYNAVTGELKNRITQGDWLVREVERVDEDARQIWFQALAIRPGQDPYYIHHARINFDGAGLIILTEGDGDHRVQYSPDHKYLVDTYSRVDMPPIHELRSAKDGSLILELERADDSALRAASLPYPERFTAKGRDGQTDILGVVYRPTHFDPAKQYPVIEAIYAGPQSAFVPKSFSAFHRPQALAELGFIVVEIDGMGTNWRSKAFHNVAWKNLKDAGFPDRILWIKAAAHKYPSMDLTRIGIYGGSAGGQNALGALLFHPDFYKAAAADCGCHDNRMDKIWWNEAWMGWPIGPEYAESSNVVNAHKLRGKLLLTVGELDRNVDPASTMQVVNALIKAKKDFDLVVFPGADHGAGSSPYGDRRRNDFFVKHLLNVTPPDRNAESADAPSLSQGYQP